MSIETRGYEAAEALRSATPVDVEAGLSQLRRTQRRRTTGRLVAAGAVVAAVAGGLATVERTSGETPPAVPPAQNGLIVHAGERQLGGTPVLPAQAPFPLWQGVDPRSGTFLYASADGMVSIVDETGAVARFDCGCELDPYPGGAAFGPGDDEVTVIGPHSFGAPPTSLPIVGDDGTVREQLQLPLDLLPSAAEVKLMTWAPDRRELAVAMESPSGGPAEVWVLSRDGSSARLIHRETAPTERVEGRFVNEPVPVDIAWSPDGKRIGILLAHSFQNAEGSRGTPAQPRPKLIVVPAGGGAPRTLHTFDFRSPNSTVSTNFIRNWAFAWSPDGQRIAVVSQQGVTELSAIDGQVLTEHVGVDQYGPLVWLPE